MGVKRFFQTCEHRELPQAHALQMEVTCLSLCPVTLSINRSTANLHASIGLLCKQTLALHTHMITIYHNHMDEMSSCYVMFPFRVSWGCCHRCPLQRGSISIMLGRNGFPTSAGIEAGSREAGWLGIAVCSKCWTWQRSRMVQDPVDSLEAICCNMLQ